MRLSDTSYEAAADALIAESAFGAPLLKRAFGEGVGDAMRSGLSDVGQAVSGVDWKGLISRPEVMGALLGAGGGGLLGGLSGLMRPEGSVAGGAMSGALAGGLAGGGAGLAYPHLKHWLSPDAADPAKDQAVEAMGASPGDVVRDTVGAGWKAFPMPATAAVGLHDAATTAGRGLFTRKIEPGASRLPSLLERGIADGKGPTVDNIRANGVQTTLDAANGQATGWRGLPGRLRGLFRNPFAKAPPAPGVDDAIIGGAPGGDVQYPPSSQEYRSWKARQDAGTLGSHEFEPPTRRVEPTPGVTRGQVQDRTQAGFESLYGKGKDGKPPPQSVRRNVFTGADSVHTPLGLRGRLPRYAGALGLDLLARMGSSYLEDGARRQALERYTPGAP